MADRHVVGPRPEYEEEGFDAHGWLAAAQRGLGDVDALSPRIGLAHRGTTSGSPPPVSVTLTDGSFEDVLVILARAGITSAPASISLPTWREGAAILEWPLGALGGIPVRVRWLVSSPGEVAAGMERGEDSHGQTA